MARMRANIWKFQYERIAENFFTATGNTLKRGLKVLLSVSVSFHEQYGVSLVVKNIDASYSLGDLERRKKEIIKELNNQNLIQKNSKLEMELVPKRIAVISSETAAGYGPNELLQIGFDTSPQVMSGFVNGFVHLSSDQQPFLQGYLPVLSLCQMKVMGLGALNQDTGAGFVTTENYESVMSLANAGLR